MRRYKKPYRVKKRKSIFKNRFFWFGILLLAAIGGISYFLFFSSFFQIGKVIITGQTKVSEEDIKSFVLKRNIFLINIEEIKKEISDKFPEINSIEINWGFPDALNIMVEERAPLAFWCESEECFLMDGNGVIFGRALEEMNLLKITGEKEMLNKEKISQILELHNKIKENLGVTTTQAFIASEERLNIKTSEGWEIYFNSKGNTNWQLQELGLVLEKQITPEKRKNLEYIDLRFSRVYYK